MPRRPQEHRLPLLVKETAESRDQSRSPEELKSTRAERSKETLISPIDEYALMLIGE